ncbi:hypothetical protein MMC25_000003 [Agyrium rufum]|nr:hypothetical protein [Agyrium rufum]
MGGSSSKIAKGAANAARRKYPDRATLNSNPTASKAVPTSNQPPPASGVGPTVHPETHASSTRDETINRDAQDPDFARSLRNLGPVTPSPTFSNSSTFNSSQSGSFSMQQRGSQQPSIFPDPSTNPALQIYNARSRMGAAAEQEFASLGKASFAGREFLDVVTIKQILIMRDERGMPAKEIEEALKLKSGVVNRLGMKGVVGDASTISA